MTTPHPTRTPGATEAPVTRPDRVLTRPQWPHHMRFATTVDVEETATGSTVGPAEVAWQMTAHEVRALGGLGWGGSLVLRSKSKGLSELLDGARACIPHEVFPRFDDSAVDLRCRLRDSDFLDDIHCLKGGKGPGRVRLNATCYPQPREDHGRRRSFRLASNP